MELTPEQRAEIDTQKATNAETKRPTVEALESILFEPIALLDHGFLRVVDYMGDDSAVVQAARVSYGKGTRKVSTDAGLINYLMRHRHTTPFEMCEIKFHVKLPIFVARQWIRHRMASVNEYSARYSVLDKEYYIPEAHHLAAQSSANRQGRGDTLDSDSAAAVLNMLKTDAEQCYQHYEQMLNEDRAGNVIDPHQFGLARELARMNLTLNTYTQWYWKIDLHNLFHFLALRADAHAQFEIRVYADAILNVVERWVPLCHAAFVDYIQGGTRLSSRGLAVIRRLIAGENVTELDSGMSSREWRELMTVLGRPA